MIGADISSFDKRAKIRVIGVGGGGNNAVDRMIDDNVEGIEFIAVNTDAQVLSRSKAQTRIQLGEKLTQGLGAGGDPDIGAKAADESLEDLAAAITGTDMLFITAGMGGGTGTGAAPVIAAVAKKQNILTVGVVTKPFAYEGKRRMDVAQKGIEELFKNVDTLLVVPNAKLLEIMDDSATMIEAYKKADEVLTQSVQGLSNIITNSGTINMDFADIRSAMRNKGMAHIGIGWASGKNRAMLAAENAISSPLLETSIVGADSVLVNMVGPMNVGLHETNAASTYIHDRIGRADCNFIFGTMMEESSEDKIIITVVATGFNTGATQAKPVKIIDHGGSKPNSADPDEPNNPDTTDNPTPSDTPDTAPPQPNEKSDTLKNGSDIQLPVFVRRNRGRN